MEDRLLMSRTIFLQIFSYKKFAKSYCMFLCLKTGFMFYFMVLWIKIIRISLHLWSFDTKRIWRCNSNEYILNTKQKYAFIQHDSTSTVCRTSAFNSSLYPVVSWCWFGKRNGIHRAHMLLVLVLSVRN